MTSANAAPDQLRLERDGAQWWPGALSPDALTALQAILTDLPAGRAGVRLFNIPGLAPWLDAAGPIGALAGAHMSGAVRPVRAILFDKTAAANWSLGWHQDRVIAVRARTQVAGFGPWTRKHGALHVAPPFGVLAGMITLRLHLDPVGAENGPLLIAPGSHRLGAVAAADAAMVAARCGSVACLAAAGDAWLYATPILHASGRVAAPGRRRVLQVDYSAGDLPGGLEWMGV